MSKKVLTLFLPESCPPCVTHRPRSSPSELEPTSSSWLDGAHRTVMLMMMDCEESKTRRKEKTEEIARKLVPSEQLRFCRKIPPRQHWRPPARLPSAVPYDQMLSVYVMLSLCMFSVEPGIIHPSIPAKPIYSFPSQC
jgi:hypothetical protein